MKICMLAGSFPPDIGGAAAHIYELSTALLKQGNEVYVIAFTTNPHLKKDQEINGIEVYRIYTPPIRLAGLIVCSFKAWLRLRALIKDKNIDLIHYHNLLPCALVARFTTNIPKVQTEHSSGFLMAVEKGEYKRLYRWLFSQSDYVIGASQVLVDNLIKYGVSRDKTSFIGSGVDVERFNPTVDGGEVRERYCKKPNEDIILCPARLDPVKGVRYLIRAIPYIIKQNDSPRLLIVGDGPEMEKLNQEIVRLQIADRVTFAGRIPNSEMPKYYAASDIVVLPSLMEGTSVAGLEAIATGKPLVGTNVGGNPQIIADGETGILVPPKNPEELAHAITSLLSDKGKRTAMGLKARKRAESEFSWQIIARKIQDIYYSVAQSKGKTIANRIR